MSKGEDHESRQSGSLQANELSISPDTLTLAGTRMRGNNAPPMSFLKWSPKRWAGHDEMLQSFGGISRATFGRKK